MISNWVDRNINPMVKVLNKEVDLGEPTSSLDHFYLGCTPRQCLRSKDICENYRTMFESRNSAGRNWKTTILGKSSYFFVVLRYGRSCREMCGTILWVGKQDDSTKLQSIYAVHWWPPRQRGRNDICRRIVQSMLSNCSEMLALGAYWKTWYSMVCDQTCTIDNKWTKAYDKRLSRLISYIHHTCECKQYCYVGNTAKQCRLGLFQDSDFAGDLEDSKSTVRSWGFKIYCHTFVPRSWMCKKQTSVSHSSTESETFLWMRDWGWMVFPHLIYGIWSLQFLGTRISTIKNRANCQWTNVKLVLHLTRFTNARNIREWSMIWIMLIVFPQTSNLLIRMLCCMCLRTTKQWSRWWKKEGSPTMRHVSGTLRVALDYLFDRINLNPKIQIKIHWHQKTTRRHTDQRKFHTWWMESSFVLVSTIAISVLQSVLK